MITYISGSELIGRIDHDLGLDNADWISRAPLWIADCIAIMDILPASEDVKVEVEIIDYQCYAPINLKMLHRITIDNQIITLSEANNAKFVEDVPNFTDHSLKYSVRSAPNTTINGVATTSLRTLITFGVESGTAVFYYTIPAVEVINEYNVVMPKVINDIFVIEAIKWFILTRLLQNGYSHPVFTLKENNKFVNPGLLWEEALKKARNSVGTMDQNERHMFSKLNREFIQNYDFYYSEGFKQIATT